MKYLTPVILLYCGVAMAAQNDYSCVEHEVDPALSFEGSSRFITEEDEPDPLGTAMVYTTKKYGHACDNGCADLAWYNALIFASSRLWEGEQGPNGEILLDNCGGDVICQEPVRAHNVQCTVTVGDCDYMDIRDMSHDGALFSYIYTRIKAQYHLECLGDLSCKDESRPIQDCCSITG